MTGAMQTRRNKTKVAARKAKLHDQEWRGFQPVLGSESRADKFKAALKRAQGSREAKRRGGRVPRGRNSVVAFRGNKVPDPYRQGEGSGIRKFKIGHRFGHPPGHQQNALVAFVHLQS